MVDMDAQRPNDSATPSFPVSRANQMSALPPGWSLDDVYIASRVDRQVIRAGQRCAHCRAGRLIDRIATREEFYLIGSEIEGVNFVRCRGRNKYHLIAVGQRFNFHILGPLVVGSVHRVRPLTGRRCCRPR